MNKKKHVFAFRFQMFSFFCCRAVRTVYQEWKPWALEGGALALLDFEIFSKKGCFPDFEWEKTNYTTFGLPGKIFENLPSAPPPLEKMFPTPLVKVTCLSAGFEVFYYA